VTQPVFNRFRIVVPLADGAVRTILPTDPGRTPQQYAALVAHFSRLPVRRWLGGPEFLRHGKRNLRSKNGTLAVAYELEDGSRASLTVTASGRASVAELSL
jgi:hypothetical protein